MDVLEQLKLDVREGRLGVERLFDVLTAQQRQLEAQQRQLQAAHQRIAELEKQTGGAATAKVAEPFSLRAEEKR